MLFEKKGLIFRFSKENDWWHSHSMAPSAILLNEKVIRIYFGAWDKYGISRITYIDVERNNPQKIIKISETPVLDIGKAGCFDENGVFPAHVSIVGKEIFLYYSGFQLGHKVPHYNFGGLAISDISGNKIIRYSESPILDRKDEGLFVRAGQSVLIEGGVFKTVYSAGSGWIDAGGKLRPTYDVFYQVSADGKTYADNGKAIIKADHFIEHGLGRPQLIKLKNGYYIFYTRRLLSMKYYFGVAKSIDCLSWERIDGQIKGIDRSIDAWDSEMIYFPSVVDSGDKIFMFYCGNNFGETGLGYAEIIEL